MDEETLLQHKESLISANQLPRYIPLENLRAGEIAAVVPPCEIGKGIRQERNAFFAHGIQDDIFTNLTRIAELRVVSRSSIIAYRQPQNPGSKSELGGYILQTTGNTSVPAQ